MKAMAWADIPRYFRKPSRVLGFLLFVVLVMTFLLISWQDTGMVLFYWPVKAQGIKQEQWPVMLAAVAAIAGWITTSIVTIRNSVKQHTINTLLQSRLSATYMDHVKAVNSAFSTMDGKIIPLTKEELRDTPAEINLYSLGYLLNYLEFIAIGIRNFDLDERVMKSSLRGIVCSIVAVSKELIDSRRIAQTNGKTPTVYENLVWLNKRWDVPDLRLEPAVRVKKNIQIPLQDK